MINRMAIKDIAFVAVSFVEPMNLGERQNTSISSLIMLMVKLSMSNDFSEKNCFFKIWC